MTLAFVWIWCRRQAVWSNGKSRITAEVVYHYNWPTLVEIAGRDGAILPCEPFKIMSHLDVARSLAPEWTPLTVEEIKETLDGK